jgi:hypothetical protein
LIFLLKYIAFLNYFDGRGKVGELMDCVEEKEKFLKKNPGLKG